MAALKKVKMNQKWPWVLLILILVLLFFYMTFTNSTEEKTSNVPQVESDYSIEQEIKDKKATPYTKSAEETAEYLSLIGDRFLLGSDPNYTRAALVQLINMVRTTAMEHQQGEIGLLDSLKHKAQTIRDQSTASKLAADIKTIGDPIYELIVQLEREKFPELGLEAQQVKSTWEAVNPNVAIEEQQEAIINFFVSCGEAVKKMNLNQ